VTKEGKRKEVMEEVIKALEVKMEIEGVLKLRKGVVNGREIILVKLTKKRQKIFQIMNLQN